MKKSYKKIVLAIAIFAAVSNVAFADGNAFTPLNFDDTTTAAPAVKATSAPKSAPAATKAQNPVASALAKVMPQKSEVPAIDAATGEPPIGNDNIQNAILELDNAQVGIRNDLMTYKAKYADVDAQYKLIKNERSMLDKQVKSIERRIRNIDKAKERIRKNML